MAKYGAFGAKISDSTGDIAQVTNIVGPNLSLDVADVTQHDGDGWEEVVPTILRSGTVSLSVAFDPTETSMVRLISAMTGRTTSTYTLTFPTAGNKTWSFSAYVTGISPPTLAVEGAMLATVTLKPTGKVTT